jgi:hypothetical protein
MMGPLVVGEPSHPQAATINRKPAHPKDLSFQKEMAFWEPKNGVLVEWSANRKCALSSALFRRVKVPLALK